MALHIPYEVLKQAGRSEEEARIEFASRLFDAGKLTLWQAAVMAGLDRSGMEAALLERNIPIYRPTIADLEQDLRTIEKWRK